MDATAAGLLASQDRSAGMDKQPVLSENDAMQIALAWGDQLEGRVRLELDAASETFASSIVPSFEWVTFVFDGNLDRGLQHVDSHEKIVACARAATIAWFALSCCEGYSGTENPQFWRRVFYELLHPRNVSKTSSVTWSRVRSQRPITHAIRFFDHIERPFPRVKLVVGQFDDETTVTPVFLGRVVHEDTTRDTHLLDILTKLQPFIRVSSAMRRVPVEIDLLAASIMKPMEHLRDIPTCADMQRVGAVSVDCLMEFPQLDLKSIALPNAPKLSIYSLHLLIPSSNVEVRLRGSLPYFVHDHQLCRGLLNQLQGKSRDDQGPRWRIDHLRVVQARDLSFSYFSVLCSALPHIRSVSSLMLPVDRYFKGIPSSFASDWAWLGYAIFHPDVVSSLGLTSLAANVRRLTSADVADLAKMAHGNNLLGGGSTDYLEGRVRCMTEVREDLGNGGERSLHTFTAEEWVGLCTPAADQQEHPDWIRAVIPGYGNGWIRRDDIVETRTRKAGKSCIRTLRVNGFSKAGDEDMNENALLGLLDVLGSQLTSLHLDNNDNVSVTTVQAILHRCPSLKSLRLRHDGSFWNDEALVVEKPLLEELELTVGWPTVQYHQFKGLESACIPRVRALRVISTVLQGYWQHGPILTALLSQAPRLQYLHYFRRSHWYTYWEDSPLDATSGSTRHLLSKLPVNHMLSHGPLGLDCRLAFLSVVHEDDGQSSMRHLGADTVRLIFEYVSSCSVREIFIG